MNCKYVFATLAIAGTSLTSATVQASEGFKCKTRSDLVGPCWTVHGRLRIGNGTPSTRIWPIGTKRLLGVEDAFFDGDEEYAGPAELRQYGLGSTIYADFLVCPLAKEEPGAMQMVCVSGAKHIHIEKSLDKNLDEIDPPIWLTPPDTDEY